jgi:predicted HTH transcriptional regulator
MDTLLIMRKKENNRCVYSEQRYGENLPETVAHFDPQTGRVLPGGELKAVQIAAYRTKILEAIGSDTLTEPDIKEGVGGNSTHTAKALRELVDDGVVRRTGAGKKGQPYRYAKHEESSILDFTPKANPESETDDAWMNAVNF